MTKIIQFVLILLSIRDSGDLIRRWDECLDYFFYFNKGTGCGVPSLEEVRRYL